METYVITFNGVPFSQVDKYVDYNDPLKKALQILCDDEPTVEEVIALDLKSYFANIEINKKDQLIFSKFVDWVNLNQKEINRLKLGFHSSYHGGNEMPAFFGSMDHGIGMPDGGCSKIDTTRFNAIIKMEKAVKKLFSTIPKELIKRFPPFGEAGYWAIESSS